MADPTPGPTSAERMDRERKKKLSVLKMSAKDMTEGMEKIKTAEIDALIQQSVEIDIMQVDILMFSIFEFQGFDPFAIIKKLIFLKNQYGLTDEDLKVDIMYMIAANIYMGNLSGKALARRSNEGREVNDELVARYQIQVGTTGTGIPSDVITYPRVSGSFPVVSCRMARRLPTKDFCWQALHVSPSSQIHEDQCLCHILPTCIETENSCLPPQSLCCLFL